MSIEKQQFLKRMSVATAKPSLIEMPSSPGFDLEDDDDDEEDDDTSSGPSVVLSSAEEAAGRKLLRAIRARRFQNGIIHVSGIADPRLCT